MTRPASALDAKNHLAKAQEILALTATAFENRQHAGTATNSIQCAISSLDAPTAAKKGLRATGDHKAVLELVQPLLDPKEFSVLRLQFSFLLGMKNDAQYDSKPMSRAQAHSALRAACRIHDRATSKIERARGASAGGS